MANKKTTKTKEEKGQITKKTTKGKAKTPTKKSSSEKVSKESSSKKTTTKVKEDAYVPKKKETSLESINLTIQSVVSVLFTIVIFIALFFLIIVLYNNYLKPKNQDLDKVCQDYLPKDYHITSEMIDNFIINARGVIYNIGNFEKDKISDDDILNFATYFIWGTTEDYIVCQDEEEKDENCLTSKIEMPYQELQKYFKNYLGLNDLKINYKNNFTEDDQIRVYEKDGKVVLSFSEFEYESLKHTLAYTNIINDKVTLVFALEKKNQDNDTYEYQGSKIVELKYQDKNLIIESIKTSLIA